MKLEPTHMHMSMRIWTPPKVRGNSSIFALFANLSPQPDQSEIDVELMITQYEIFVLAHRNRVKVGLIEGSEMKDSLHD